MTQSVLPFAARLLASSPGPRMPYGALGIWYMDQAVSYGGRYVVPNAVAATPPTQTLIGPPRRQFVTNDFWPTRSGVTATDQFAVSHDGIIGGASRLQFGASGFIQLNAALSAGTYLFPIWVRSTGGGDSTFGLTIGGTTKTLTANAGWQRLKTDPVTVAGGATSIAIVGNAGGTTDIVVSDANLFAGSADLGAQPLAGHLYMGPYIGSHEPSYATGAFDFSSDGFGFFQFTDILNSGAMTAIVVAEKVATPTGDLNGFISKMAGYQDLTAYFDATGRPAFLSGAPTFLDFAGLLDLKTRNPGYHMISIGTDLTNTFQYIGATQNAVVAGGLATTQMQDLLCGSVSGDFSGLKIAAMALY